MTQKNSVLSMLGLAAKAGKIASGEFSVEKAVKSGKAFLVMIAEDAWIIQKRCSGICVNIMKCRWKYLRRKKNWDIGSVKHTGLPSVS